MNIIGAKRKGQVIPSLQKSPWSEAPEPRIPSALASRGGECGANGKSPQRNEPELWTQPAPCCSVTLNQVSSLSGPQCPCESNEGLGRGGLRTQAASLHLGAGSGSASLHPGGWVWGCIFAPGGWVWGRQGCSRGWEDSAGFVDRPFSSRQASSSPGCRAEAGRSSLGSFSPRSTEPATGSVPAS